MHGMHNHPISDIKQVDQRVIEFGTKREEPEPPVPERVSRPRQYRIANDAVPRVDLRCQNVTVTMNTVLIMKETLQTIASIVS